MIQSWKALFVTGFIFFNANCFAASTQLNDTLQVSSSDTVNTLQGQIASPKGELDWRMDLGLTTYQDRLENGDQITLFRTNLEFFVLSNILVGAGVNYGYSGLEKLTSFEPHIEAGIHGENLEIRTVLHSIQYRQGASPAEPSTGNVNEDQDFKFKMSGATLDLRARLGDWMDGHFAFTQMRSSPSFSDRSTGKVGTPFVARRFGPLVSTVDSVFKKYQIFEFVFRPADNINVNLQHNRSQAEISSQWSVDTSALLDVRVGPFWDLGYGLGESSTQAQSEKYAIFSLGYRF